MFNYFKNDTSFSNLKIKLQHECESQKAPSKKKETNFEKLNFWVNTILGLATIVSIFLLASQTNIASQQLEDTKKYFDYTRTQDAIKFSSDSSNESFNRISTNETFLEIKRSNDLFEKNKEKENQNFAIVNSPIIGIENVILQQFELNKELNFNVSFKNFSNSITEVNLSAFIVGTLEVSKIKQVYKILRNFSNPLNDNPLQIRMGPNEIRTIFYPFLKANNHPMLVNNDLLNAIYTEYLFLYVYIKLDYTNKINKKESTEIALQFQFEKNNGVPIPTGKFYEIPKNL